jgi:hypothetical protein
LPQLHTGTSPADAIVMDAHSPDDAKRWEDMYVAIRPCASGGNWREEKRTTQTESGTPYDAVTVSCSAGGAMQTFYFRSAPLLAPHAG